MMLILGDADCSASCLSPPGSDVVDRSDGMAAGRCRPVVADYGSYSMVHQILMGVLLALLLNTSAAAFAATFIDGSEGDFCRSARGQEGKVRT